MTKTPDGNAASQPTSHVLHRAVAKEKMLIQAMEVLISDQPETLKPDIRRILRATDDRSRIAAINDLMNTMLSSVTGMMGGRPADKVRQKMARTAYRAARKRGRNIGTSVQAACKASGFSAAYVRKLKRVSGWDDAT